jgi:hypothetical protein
MKLVLLIPLLVVLVLILSAAVHQSVIKSANVTYPDHIDGPFTGGFGEESCHSCHFDYDINHPEGSLEIRGLNTSYKPGHTYEFEILVSRHDMLKAGIQMTARFEDGRQAGNFALNDSLTFTPGIEGGVQYLQHAPGTIAAGGGNKTWTITWTAPDQSSGDVIFNIAANAATGDQSEFGDWIYVEEVLLIDGIE